MLSKLSVKMWLIIVGIFIVISGLFYIASVTMERPAYLGDYLFKQSTFMHHNRPPTVVKYDIFTSVRPGGLQLGTTYYNLNRLYSKQKIDNCIIYTFQSSEKWIHLRVEGDSTVIEIVLQDKRELLPTVIVN